MVPRYRISDRGVLRDRGASGFRGYPQNSWCGGPGGPRSPATYSQTGGTRVARHGHILSLHHGARPITPLHPLVSAASLTLIVLALAWSGDMEDRLARTVCSAHLPGAIPNVSPRAMIEAGYTPPVNAPPVHPRQRLLSRLPRAPHLGTRSQGLGSEAFAISADQRRALDPRALAYRHHLGGPPSSTRAEARLLPPVMVAAALGFGFFSTTAGSARVFRHRDRRVPPSVDRAFARHPAKGDAWFQYMDEDSRGGRDLRSTGHSPRGLVAVAADDRGYPLAGGSRHGRRTRDRGKRSLVSLFPKQRDLSDSISRVFDDHAPGSGGIEGGGIEGHRRFVVARSASGPPGLASRKWTWPSRTGPGSSSCAAPASRRNWGSSPRRRIMAASSDRLRSARQRRRQTPGSGALGGAATIRAPKRETMGRGRRLLLNSSKRLSACLSPVVRAGRREIRSKSTGPT